MTTEELLSPSDTFARRHIGPSDADVESMLKTLALASLDELSDQAVPKSIHMQGRLSLPPALTESELLARAAELAGKNQVNKSYIGLGYYDCITPGVILRNVLENPGWYTQYTPYQAEISQGRLEALINFQTMLCDLTGLPLANASMLDEGTAAAEAMSMALAIGKHKRNAFFIDDGCFPQTVSVVETRAEPLGIKLVRGDATSFDFSGGDFFGVLVQYPNAAGQIHDYREAAKRAHDAGALFIAAADLLALTLITPPGEFGADIAVGSTQRFGVPLGFGGPHAGYLSTREEFKRQIPGRLVGVSKDSAGKPAYRLALQTREQHIRRDRATSNICTAQVLLAIMAGMYAVYHGPDGLRRIARRVRALTRAVATGLRELGFDVDASARFDTVSIPVSGDARGAVVARAMAAGINLRVDDTEALGISLDETTTVADATALLAVFAGDNAVPALGTLTAAADDDYAEPHRRTSDFLTHPVFHSYHAEHEMLRYLGRLQARDLSLTTSMIPLGSCTMKLNATTEMVPVTWPEFAGLHPFAPTEQSAGYADMFADLETWLAEITGFAAVSLQPNAGAQGEYAGLLVIRAYHQARGDHDRDVCLIPVSAHGTNPASAVMAGFKVVAVKCDDHGNIDLADLRSKADQHKDKLGALMVTYPSTHGVFEAAIVDICAAVHDAGGQVYLDGANMNAQVGLCRPGDYGADVCHLNLHKTFCIPHGGGGPGMGPIGMAAHLAPHLPGHPLRSDVGGEDAIGPISAAPYGSPAILPISWSYIAMMGEAGLRRASQIAILNANYMAERLKDHYPVLYTGESGRCAHEFIIDVRPLKKAAGIEVDDIAKRLMDYGFHAPTMSFPVAGTLMIEPTESESKAELDRFCDAMIAIRQEVAEVESGALDKDDNPLKNAPHTMAAIAADEWSHSYSRARAAFPVPHLYDHKFWPAVGRIDNAYGDRNLFCSCVPMEEMADA